jgi:hypothetical protein
MHHQNSLYTACLKATRDKASAKTRGGTRRHGVSKGKACSDGNPRAMRRISKEGGKGRNKKNPAMTMDQPIDIDAGPEGEVGRNMKTPCHPTDLSSVSRSRGSTSTSPTTPTKRNILNLPNLPNIPVGWVRFSSVYIRMAIEVRGVDRMGLRGGGMKMSLICCFTLFDF